MAKVIHHAEIGRRIKQFRLQAGYTQERLAEVLEITFQQVQKYERGVTKVNLDRLQQISEVLNVPIAAFFNESPFVAYNLTEKEEALLEAFRKIKDERLKNSLLEVAVSASKTKG